MGGACMLYGVVGGQGERRVCVCGGLHAVWGGGWAGGGACMLCRVRHSTVFTGYIWLLGWRVGGGHVPACVCGTWWSMCVSVCMCMEVRVSLTWVWGWVRVFPGVLTLHLRQRLQHTACLLCAGLAALLTHPKP